MSENETVITQPKPDATLGELKQICLNELRIRLLGSLQEPRDLIRIYEILCHEDEVQNL